MKPITYYINFPLAAQIQRCLDELSSDQKIELAFAIGQRALDENRSADVISREGTAPDALVSIEEVDNSPLFVSFICDACEMESYQRFNESEDLCIGCGSFEMAS
jgi:hypothetical protein